MKKSIFAGLMLSLSAFALEPNKGSLPGDQSGTEVASEATGTIVGLPEAEARKNIKLEFPVERMTLANGMVFLLHSHRSIPIVSYHTWFRVGAKDELPGESGLAHMFEHMMFKGTKKYPNKEFDRILQANGIVNNAFTNQDYTGYYEVLPSSKLEMMMDMESDRLQSLNLVDEEFQKEREVVKEERRMRYDNDPGGMGWEKLNSLVFNDTKYGLPVIGTMKEINEFTVDKLQRFYKKWYVPSNAVVVIVGDFDLKETKAMITKYYASIKSPARPVRQNPIKDLTLGRRDETVSFPVQSPELLWGSRTVKSGTDESYALDLLGSILGQGKSSRLFQELIYKQQLALSAGSGHYTMQDSGMFYIQAVAKPGVSASRVKTILEAEVERFLKQPIKDEELSKAKNMVLSDYVESLKTNDGKAKILAMNEILLGDYREFFRDIDRYLKVSLDDLNRVKGYLALNKMINVVVDTRGGKQK
jgi:zinc protease